MSVQNILTDITNNTSKVQAEQAATRRGQTTMDQDAFLQLLMAQLKYQDPLNPMGNSEFISQQAQFTQISEMQKLNQTNNLMQASTLIGHQVSFQDPDDVNSKITGVVKEAKISAKGTNVLIDGVKTALDGTQTQIKDVEYSSKLISSIR